MNNSRTVKDLSNSELIHEIDILDTQIDAQSKIMSAFRGKRKECINELIIRMKGDEENVVS